MGVNLRPKNARQSLYLMKTHVVASPANTIFIVTTITLTCALTAIFDG